MSDSNPLIQDASTPLFQAVLRICRIVREAGGRAVLVGGCVRDALQNIPSKDMDLECYGVSAEQIKQTVGAEFTLDLVGMSFGVFKVHRFEIDIALPRRENKTGAGHRGFLVDCIPGLSFAEASARRDFTVNAMMFDPLNNELIDPWNGQTDLKNAVLRHVSDHFAEDPLRVLRAMQFTARFDFTVAPETIRLCRSIPSNELAVERIASEWEKLLIKGVALSKGLRFLQECRWIDAFPPLAELEHSSLWEQTLAAADRIPRLRSGVRADDLFFALAVLCSFMTQENAAAFLLSNWNSPELSARVLPLAENHSVPGEFYVQRRPDADYRRLSLVVKRMDLLRKTAECTGVSPDAIDAFGRKTVELGIDSAPPKPILQGRDLIAKGISPGPQMGCLLKDAFEAQLDGVFADIQGARAWLTQRTERFHGNP